MVVVVVRALRKEVMFCCSYDDALLIDTDVI